MLSDKEFTCEKNHYNKSLNSHVFLNLHQDMMPKTGDKTIIENMIDNLFHYRLINQYCKTCKKVSIGEFKRTLIALPKTLIVVVDRMTFKGVLRDLISSFPLQLDLKKHYVSKNKKRPKDHKDNNT